jgi:hypothetical protein
MSEIAGNSIDSGVAECWVETKRYTNERWVGFTPTPEGKKLVKLTNGGGVIQWRPAAKTFSAIVTTLTANPLEARDTGPIQDGVGEASPPRTWKK